METQKCAQSSSEAILSKTPSYTKALFASIPDIKRKERRVSLSGELPQHTEEFQGCVFHTRCPYARNSAVNVHPR